MKVTQCQVEGCSNEWLTTRVIELHDLIFVLLVCPTHARIIAEKEMS
ncbi:MAG: hypothetical protein HKN01_01470 [Acidimicrobiia bacterium]|nr:hypothetical protein [Acidimicrobiia bacterium]